MDSARIRDRFLFILWMLFIWMLFIGFGCPDSHGMELSISGQTMTLEAHETPLQSIFTQLGALGILVEAPPQVNPLITADFRNENIQDGLNRILGENSHALVWTTDPQGLPVLAKIIVKNGRGMGSTPGTAPHTLAIARDPATGSLYVKNRLLIQFQSPGDSKQIQAILERLNAGINLVHEGLGLYEITLPESSSMEEARTAFGNLEGVGTVEPDYAYTVPAPVQYKTDHQIPRNQTGTASSGVSPVAVMDSGLDPEYLSRDLNLASLDALAPEEAISDSAGHGTQMALIASGQVNPAGIGNEAFSNPVLSIRAFDDNGYTSNTVLLRGIDFAIENGAKVLSLSWGSETDSAFLKQAMAYARSRGLTIVAAAGNRPTGKAVYPSAYDTVISVSALAPDGKVWDQSNFGDFVDISAPGFAQLPVGYNGDPGTYAGTSIATAYVAGKIAAYLRKNPGKKLPLKRYLKNGP